MNDKMKNMRKILILLIVCTAFLWSCEGMYDKQEMYEGEIIYPAKYDTVIGHIGYERVEIDLLKSGRVPSEQINLGKAKQTRIEYDDQVITIDSLVSYVNITGLTQSKLYRFRIYTIDQYGNESVPQEIALIPFTSNDLASYAVTPPRIMASPSAAVVDWPNGISSVLLDYYGLKFEYTDKDGNVQSGTRGTDSRFFVGNIEGGKPLEIDMEYKIIPRLNRQPIIDTVVFKNTLTVNTPTGSTVFSPAERDVLTANGVTTFTADGVSDVENLIYPVHANSLQDIFYFPNLKTIDFTGGEIFPMTVLNYNRNDAFKDIGGGEYVPFASKVGDIPEGDKQVLKDYLEAGLLEKVYYYPHTMGLDELLMPYVESGVVELVETPDEILVGNEFQLDGNVQDRNWNIDVTYPATDAPEGEGLENTYKLTLKARSASFVIALPREYKFNAEEYKYLKMKVYAPGKAVFDPPYEKFKCFWTRIMNHMWAFGSNSSFGQEYWELPHYCLSEEALESWTDVTIDLNNAVGKHNRIIVLNIGTEPSMDFNKDIVYYLSNLRFSKEP